jgi:hypothetical protein
MNVFTEWVAIAAVITLRLAQLALTGYALLLIWRTL